MALVLISNVILLLDFSFDGSPVTYMGMLKHVTKAALLMKLCLLVFSEFLSLTYIDIYIQCVSANANQSFPAKTTNRWKKS